MTNMQTESAQTLRQRAEEKSRFDESSALKTLSLKDAQLLFHELRVYQIELEMQNEELRRAQHELGASRARYINLYDQAPVGYLTLNEQGVIEEANLAVATMFGVPRNALLEKPISEFIFREDQDAYCLHRKKVYEESEVQDWEMRMVRADGSLFWARLLATPAQDGEYLIALHDITKRKRTEDALRESELRFRSYFDLGLIGMAITSLDKRWVQFNDQLCSIFGYPREELASMTWAQNTYPDDLAADAAQFEHVLRGESEGYSMDKRFVRKDGSIVYCDISVKCVLNQDGTPNHFVAMFRDITERKLSERVLQSRLIISEYAYKHLLDELLTKVLDEAEVLTDSQIGFFHFVDADQATLLKQAWSTNTLSTICTAEEKGKHYPLDHAGVWADCIREKRALIHNSYESLLHRKGMPPGHAPVQRELVVPIFRNKLIVAVLGVGNKKNDYTARDMTTLQHLANLAWDIVKRKLAELELQQAKEAAEAANRAKSDFLATMSHEIRTPLGAMLGNVELMEGSTLTPQQQECLRDCKSASQMLLQVINDVLDFSKIEAGKLELFNKTFSVPSMGRQLARMFSAAAKQKGLDLSITLAGDLPEYIYGDQQRLHQIISNLLSNAIKFTRCGTVSMEISREQSPSATIPDKSVLRIVVRDTGIGIPFDKQDQIFDRFTQVESFSTRSASGTGLGLSICRSLLALMGGLITVSSVPGTGSVFTVLLPVLVSQPQPQPQHQIRDQAPSRKILLADDDERGRAVAQKLLQRRGYKVTAVESGAGLLEVLEKEEFDIVLTDISMPDMEGTQVARIIRSGERAGIDPLVPIIAMTAHAFSEDRERFLAAGINGYVAKPVNLVELFRQIEELCSRSSE